MNKKYAQAHLLSKNSIKEIANLIPNSVHLSTHTNESLDIKSAKKECLIPKIYFNPSQSTINQILNYSRKAV